MPDPGPTAAAPGPPGPWPVGRAEPPAGTGLGPARATPTGRYRWPTGGEVPVLREFDAPLVVWGAGHRGVDLQASVGAVVLAAADGVVVFAGTVVDRPVVSVQHADGIRTTYEPVAPTVSAGDRVSAGDVLGHLEAGHCAPRSPACLHLGARTGADSYIDPLTLLGADVVIRLLPFGPRGP
ncbi:murein hydrolase activator EnvC family protein [Georgenia alba]|uniref:Murein hydrolase activator EnvC family protein n=1 Tax=Georgenia alba TaxID=2233858 RepID=A0ABW2Q782_9MICO